MLNKEHNTYEGLQDIVNIRSSLNLGLSNELKKAFPGTVPQIKPEFLLKKISDPSWLAGFATGESNFFITVQKSKSKSGLTISLRFSKSQHSRDVLLLESLVNYFGCGYVAKYEKRSVCEFIVTKIDHIVEHIIPFSLIFYILATTAPLSLLLAAYARKSKSGNDGSKNKKNKGA